MCPLLRKSYFTTYLQGSNTVVLPHTPDFWDLVRRLSNRYCPLAFSTAVSHPTSTSRLWIVGILSVRTESVGIAWCTRISKRMTLKSKKFFCDRWAIYHALLPHNTSRDVSSSLDTLKLCSVHGYKPRRGKTTVSEQHLY